MGLILFSGTLAVSLTLESKSKKTTLQPPPNYYFSLLYIWGGGGRSSHVEVIGHLWAWSLPSTLLVTGSLLFTTVYARLAGLVASPGLLVCKSLLPVGPLG